MSEYREKYLGGETAEAVYNRLITDRSPVEDLGRQMAELTVPSAYPPEGYRTGEDIPGNNQSIGAQCVNTLASVLMFLAFPPGQPIMRIEAIEHEVQTQIDEDPELWSKIQLALSRLEMSHRKRLMTTPISGVYTQYITNLLISGNSLWKHLKLNEPTCHLPSCYVVQRTNTGNPVLVIHKEELSVQAMDKDTREFILAQTNYEHLRKEAPWARSVCVYSVQCLDTDGDEPAWAYWQELPDGTMIPETDVETDFEYPPMWPGWLIPVFGQNWGRGYCEQYRGDLYSAEAQSSGFNDITALAAWALVGVDPSGQTSAKQVREAKNLSVIPGKVDTDISVFASQKTPDGNFVAGSIQTIARRLAAAFLLQASIQREGERVTAEEIKRLSMEVDKAMGGLYTNIAQHNQRPIIMRAMRLNEEENPKLPVLPKGIVEVQVVTGTDAMGQTTEAANLTEYAGTVKQMFPEERVINGLDYARRLAAAMGIKADGLVYTEDQIAESNQAAQMQAAQQTLLDKGAAPAIKAMADQAAELPPASA